MSEFAFPFVGAGDASYFEWAEVHVVFEREPSTSDRKRIAETVPAPLQDAIVFDGAFLMVASGQFAHTVMAQTYTADAGDEGLEEGRFFFAAGSQVRQFNADTDRWLTEAHAVCPILVAYRGEDMESGGTELSAWHDWSLQQADRFLRVIDRSPLDDSEHGGAFVLRQLLDSCERAGRAIPADLIDFASPGDAEFAAFEAGDVAELVRLLEKRTQRHGEVFERLFEAYDPANASEQACLVAIAPFILATDDLSDDVLEALAFVAAQSSDGVLCRQLLEATGRDSSAIYSLGFVALDLMENEEWEPAWRLFDALVALPDARPSIYGNALYSVAASNSGLGVQRERARRYIAAAEPHGPENPAIFYNIACLEMEFGNVDAVLANCALALEFGYENPEQIRDEGLFEPLHKDSRFVALFEPYVTPKRD